MLGVPELKAITVCTYQSPFISLSPPVTFIIEDTGTKEGQELEGREPGLETGTQLQKR